MPVSIPPLIPEAQPPAVRTEQDVLQFMAKEIREQEDAPIRDALIDLLLGALLAYQHRSDVAEAENDLLRSTGEHLRDDAAERGFSQGDGESEADFRDRVLTTTVDATTKKAIVAAVNKVLAPFTSTECILLESALDGWFIHDGTNGKGGDPAWHSFLEATPSYPDRFFNGDEPQNDGYARPNSDPQTARIFGGTPRQFLLLVPDLSGYSDDGAWVWDIPSVPSKVTPQFLTEQVLNGIGWFIDDGSDPNIGGSIHTGTASETVLYDLIVRTVGLLVGQSISWEMHATLTAA